MPSPQDEALAATRLAHRYDKAECIVIFRDAGGHISSSVHGCNHGEIVELTAAVLYSSASQAAKLMPRFPKKSPDAIANEAGARGAHLRAVAP